MTSGTGTNGASASGAAYGLWRGCGGRRRLREVDAKADRRGDGRAATRRGNEARGGHRIERASRKGLHALEDTCILHGSVCGDGHGDDDERVPLGSLGVRGLDRRERARRDDGRVGRRRGLLRECDARRAGERGDERTGQCDRRDRHETAPERAQHAGESIRERAAPGL